jgi:hypothetical protein
MKKQPEPILVKSGYEKPGDPVVRLGVFRRPPQVDCRVVAEPLYQAMIKALKKSGDYDKIFSNKKLSKSQGYLNQI